MQVSVLRESLEEFSVSGRAPVQCAACARTVRAGKGRPLDGRTYCRLCHARLSAATPRKNRPVELLVRTEYGVLTRFVFFFFFFVFTLFLFLLIFI